MSGKVRGGGVGDRTAEWERRNYEKVLEQGGGEEIGRRGREEKREGGKDECGNRRLRKGIRRG